AGAGRAARRARRRDECVLPRPRRHAARADLVRLLRGTVPAMSGTVPDMAGTVVQPRRRRFRYVTLKVLTTWTPTSPDLDVTVPAPVAAPAGTATFFVKA